MARKEQITYTSIQFSYEGRSFTIDLAPNNAAELDEIMQKYIDAATEVKNQSKPKSKGKGAARPGIREWAEKEGLLKSGSRGRIAKNIEEAYDAAHS